MIVASIGGGGLISGIACGAKAIRPQTRIIGVQTASCPSAYMSIRKNERIHVDAGKSIADGIAVKQLGVLNYTIIRENIDSVVLVQEDDICRAMVMLLERKKLLAEGAGAAPVAALLSGVLALPSDSRVVLVISGGNVDSPLVDRIIRRDLFRDGRIMRFSVCLEDDPGSLARLLSLVADSRANILHIFHDRSGKDLPIYLSRVELELETRGPDHVKSIAFALKEAGYDIFIRSHRAFGNG